MAHTGSRSTHNHVTEHTKRQSKCSWIVYVRTYTELQHWNTHSTSYCTYIKCTCKQKIISYAYNEYLYNQTNTTTYIHSSEALSELHPLPSFSLLPSPPRPLPSFSLLPSPPRPLPSFSLLPSPPRPLPSFSLLPSPPHPLPSFSLLPSPPHPHATVSPSTMHPLMASLVRGAAAWSSAQRSRASSNINCSTKYSDTNDAACNMCVGV